MRNLMIVIVAAALIITLSRWNKKSPQGQNDSVRNVNVVTLEEREEKKVTDSHEAALTYKQAGDPAEAVRVWKDIVTKYPKHARTDQAIYELFLYYMNKGHMNRADQYEEKLRLDFAKSEFLPSLLHQKAMYLESKGELSAAQALYRRVVKDFFYYEDIAAVQKRYEDLNIRLLFSKKLIPGTEYYVVKSGDSLSRIAKKYHVTVDFLVEANHLKKKSVIHPGDRLKVFSPHTKIAVTIDKSQKVMMLTINGEVIKRYYVAIGRNDNTPVGKFSVQNKLKDPVWFNAGKAIPPDDPRNVLGTRWIGFDRDIGIHGTVEKKHILEQTSNGCIRMNNPEVEQLYKLLRVGDPVIIVE